MNLDYQAPCKQLFSTCKQLFSTETDKFKKNVCLI